MRDIRIDYLEATEQIENGIVEMQSKGFSKEDIANYVVNMRNQQKIIARENMTAAERAGLEKRNTKSYGNPIGPTAKWLFDKMKKDFIKRNIYENDEQIWDIVINKSMEKDDVINTLLGLIH
jgi:hypothetical protein